MKYLFLVCFVITCSFAALCEDNKINSLSDHLSKFDHILLPMESSVFLFTKNILTPRINNNAQNKISIPSTCNYVLNKFLSPNASRPYWWGSSPVTWLKEVESKFANTTLDVSGKSSAITYKNSQKYFIPIDNIRERTYVKFILFELSKGVYLNRPDLKEGILFLNYDNHNLRQYTVLNDQSLFDKTFPQLCQHTKKENSKIFYTSLITTLMSGFNDQALKALTVEQRELLLSTTGIYMAEMYKTLHFGFKAYGRSSGDNTYLGVLLQRYFNQGGQIVEKLDKSYVASRKDCSFFNQNFHRNQPTRKVLERLITEHIATNQPKLLEQIQKLTPLVDNNLFDSLSTIMQTRTLTFEQSSSIASQLIDAIDDCAKNSSTFLQQVIKDASNYNILYMRLLEPPPPPPLQPYY